MYEQISLKIVTISQRTSHGNQPIMLNEISVPK
jgi:hypothetical protein